MNILNSIEKRPNSISNPASTGRIEIKTNFPNSIWLRLSKQSKIWTQDEPVNLSADCLVTEGYQLESSKWFSIKNLNPIRHIAAFIPTPSPNHQWHITFPCVISFFFWDQNPVSIKRSATHNFATFGHLERLLPSPCATRKRIVLLAAYVSKLARPPLKLTNRKILGICNGTVLWWEIAHPTKVRKLTQNRLPFRTTRN